MFSQETTRKARKVPRIGKKSAVVMMMMKIQIEDIQERSFASTMARADIQQMNALCVRHWSSRQNRKRANNFTKRKDSISGK